MLPISKVQCGGVLSVWLEQKSSPEIVKQIAREVGFNDSPFFGASKRRIKLIGEVIMVNCAISIFAVNQVLPRESAMQVINAFLLAAKTPIFAKIESMDSTFRNRYPLRLADYFKAMSGEKPSLGLSFSFMENLDLNPLNNLDGQIQIAYRFTNYLTSSIDVLKNFEFID